MASWFAQNLQRKLLLYFLQKVSLFSQIDISTLDVSLGSSSNFTFHDLELDVDSIKLPDVAVRSGFIQELELRLTVSGGVSVEGSGIVFVVKPLFTKPVASDAPNFSLSKTVYDLASSVIQIGEGEDAADDESILDDSCETDPMFENSTGGGPSVLQAMKNKALDLALSKLSIKLRNVTIKFMFPNNNVVKLMVDEVLLDSINETRDINITELSIIILKNISQAEDEDSKAEISLSESLIYSKAEAQSIYMSAIQSTSDVQDSTQNDDLGEGEIKLEIFTLDYLSMSFKGFTSIDDISMRDAIVSFDNCRIDIFSLLELNDALIVPLILLLVSKPKDKLPDDKLQALQNLKNYRRFQQEQNLQEEFPFARMHGKRVEIKLSREIVLACQDLSLTRNESTAFKLSVGEASAIYQKNSILSQTTPSDSCFLSSSLDFANGAFQINFDCGVNIELNNDVICDLFQSLILFQKCQESWTQVSPRKNKPKGAHTKHSSIQITGKGIQVRVDFVDYSLKLNISPWEGSLRSLKLQSLGLKMQKSGEEKDLMDIHKIRWTALSNPVQFRSYGSGFEEVLISSKCCIEIQSMELVSELEPIKQIISDIQEVGQKIMELSPPVQSHEHFASKKFPKHLRRSVRIMGTSSVTNKQSIAAQCIIEVGDINVSLLNPLGVSFGDIKGHIGTCMIQINTDQTFTAHAKAVDLTRYFDKLKEPFINVVNQVNDPLPVISLHRKLTNKVSCVLRSTCLNYCARWLDFVKNLEDKEMPNSKCDKEMPDSKFHKDRTSASSSSFEFRLVDCSIRMCPYRLDAELILIVSKASLEMGISSAQVKGMLKACSILLIDDASKSRYTGEAKPCPLSSFYTDRGFASIGKLDRATFTIAKLTEDVNILAELGSIGLSLCADSMQTFVQVLADLGIPITFPEEEKYVIRPSPVKVFEDIEDNFFTNERIRGDQLFSKEEPLIAIDNFLDENSDFVQQNHSLIGAESCTSGQDAQRPFTTDESYFLSNKSKKSSSIGSDAPKRGLTLKTVVNSITLKLYDGFDWKYTRSSISDMISSIESALQQQSPKEPSEGIKASLFDSIYIFAANDVDPGSFRQSINRDLQSEPSISIKGSPKKLRLRPSKNYKARVDLFCVRAIVTRFADTKSGQNDSDTSEVLNEINVSVQDVEVIDNIPSSTWNKLLTYLKEEPRARGSHMLSLNIRLVKPIRYLEATECILHVQLLPLRLHIDQDTLEFLTRFFEFKDSRFDLIDEFPDIVYIQKLEVDAVKIKMDYKPKKVDYVGLKSGHTSEFMNFFILDGSRFQLRHLIVYGINGFPELNKTLNSIWMPDITKNQLKDIIGGVGPMKTVVALGTGVKALVTTPIKEYKRDQNLGRGLQKGTQVFVKITTGEFVRLGVKLASGAQTLLENAEELMGGQGPRARNQKLGGVEVDLIPEQAFRKYEKLVGGTNPIHGVNAPESIVVEPSGTDYEVPRIYSLYADQPPTLQKGLKEAQGSLGKNVRLAYDALKRAQNEIRDSASTQETASSMARVVPVALLRPIIGATEALSKTLQGISNEIDEGQASYLRDKYKSQRSPP